ncbi:MAG: hypothetical protein HOP29_18550 [Phycisphaerales bacterium]|nr:hypothetical protein [Phycisphaerales bacterium]
MRTGNSEAESVLRERASQTVWWVIAGSLAVIAVCMVARSSGPILPEALGQVTRQAGARGIFAFSGQLTDQTHGVFMVDVDSQTLWGYEYLPASRKLRLAFARSWNSDKYLENMDCEGPSPDEIEEKVQQERESRLRRRIGEAP